MSRFASFNSLARAELSEAASFYGMRSSSLRMGFLASVEAALIQLLEYPEAAQIVRGDVRRKPLPRFPYNLLYTIRGDEIRILAVAHQSRRPFYWRGRV